MTSVGSDGQRQSILRYPVQSRQSSLHSELVAGGICGEIIFRLVGRTGQSRKP